MSRTISDADCIKSILLLLFIYKSLLQNPVLLGNKREQTTDQELLSHDIYGVANVFE